MSIIEVYVFLVTKGRVAHKGGAGGFQPPAKDPASAERALARFTARFAQFLSYTKRLAKQGAYGILTWQAGFVRTVARLQAQRHAENPSFFFRYFIFFIIFKRRPFKL